ncbi:Uncharacterized protein TCM_019112 [Theobroma cacao]|uniref:Uncharacterized protein n=1 Tax=Theobroma cacao TaxID=3641 RepID=A0A061ENJ2_THECC|nr:Uncharacterized protein TCM_019112 [Theobroma cacao]
MMRLNTDSVTAECIKDKALYFFAISSSYCFTCASVALSLRTGFGMSFSTSFHKFTPLRNAFILMAHTG